MFTLIKLIQSLFGALHSEGTPGQLAAGIVLGAFLGLTPLFNLHNAVVFALLVLLNVSFAGGLLGWALFVPVGFLLDPLFDWIGHSLLLAPALRGLWTSMYNMRSSFFCVGPWRAIASPSASACGSRDSTRR